MTGENNVGSAIGQNSKIKGINGNFVCLFHYANDGTPLGWVTGKIGEDGLKENVFYVVGKDGKFTEA